MSSDLSRMRRGELRRDRCMVSVQTGHMRSVVTGEAKPRMRKRDVQALDLSAGFGDFYKISVRDRHGRKSGKSDKAL